MVSDHAVDKGRSKSTTRRLSAEGSSSIENIRALVGVAAPHSAANQPRADNSSITDLASTGKSLVAPSAAPAKRRRASLGSRLLRLLDTFIEAERRRAIRRIHGHLRTLDDQKLMEWGFDEAAIVTLRAGGEVELPDLGTQ